MKTDHDLVSVLFITYKRIGLLKQAVFEFKRLCSYPKLELIITDDGSPSDVVDQMRLLPIDRMVTSARNTGMGANSNRGLRATTGNYVLHHQDDFVCISSEPFIERSIQIMERHPEVGLIRLHHLTPRFPICQDFNLPDGTGYSIIDFDQPPIHHGIYIYSDHPHLKRADFHQKVGYFSEGLPTGETEDDFCRRLLSNRSYKVATFWRSDFFLNLGINRSTRPDRKRAELRHSLGTHPLGRHLLYLYSLLPRSIRRKMGPR